MMIRSLFLVLALACAQAVQAQELNVTVNLQAPTAQGIDRSILNQLKSDIANYLNNRRWTPLTVAPYERIRCVLTIVLTSVPAQDRFLGTLQVQITRPVYNSTYETALVNYQDKDFQITYQPFQPLQFSDNTYIGNLPSILNFYAYLALGYDADSFSPNGGNNWFQLAQQTVNLAQNAGEPGWRSGENLRNRYWLTENLLNNSYRAFHDILYRYHRAGMDIMSEDPAKGRTVILECLQQMQVLVRANPNIIVVQSFIDAKTNELIQVFYNAPTEQKQAFLQVMEQLDPGSLNQYQRINN